MMNRRMLRALCLLAIVLSATADVSHDIRAVGPSNGEPQQIHSLQEGSDDWPLLDLPPFAGSADEEEQCAGRRGARGHTSSQPTLNSYRDHAEPQFRLLGRFLPSSFAFPQLDRREMQETAPIPSPAAIFEEDNTTSPGYFFLARNETERPNPLNQLKTYKEGWNPINKDYWAVRGDGMGWGGRGCAQGKK